MKNSAILLILAIISILHSQAQPTAMNAYPVNSVVRISIGYFQPEQTEKIKSMLNHEFKDSLIPAIKKLNGNLGYYVGIDIEKHSMTNVSFWQTKEDALQMATLKEMLDMRTTFEALGLKFIEITNHQVLWRLPEP